MSTNTLQPPAVVAEPRATAPDLDFVRRSKPANVLADALVLAKRHLIRVPRQLDWLIGVTIMPIMFLLLFRYIFADTVQATLPAGVDAVNYRVIPNSKDRFLLNKHSPLQFDPDGSLTLSFAPQAPAGLPEVNWLPTPAGDHYLLTWRSYGPDQATIAGEWFPPPLTTRG